MPQGASIPSVGTVKSAVRAVLPTGSVSVQFGSASAQGPNSRSCAFIEAKFSPLIQIRSMAPPSVRPADFSASTRLTASAVSDNFTCSSVTPYSCATRDPAQAMKSFTMSDPPQAFQYTVWPRACAVTAAQSAGSGLARAGRAVRAKAVDTNGNRQRVILGLSLLGRAWAQVARLWPRGSVTVK